MPSSVTAMKDVPVATAAWKKVVGGALGKERYPALRDCITDQCCDEFGMGVCRSAVTKVDLDRLKYIKRILWASTSLPRSRCLDVELMSLLVIQPRDCAGAVDDPPPQKVLLTLVSLLSPKPRQCFWECTYTLDAGGNAFVDIPLSLQSLTTDAEVSVWMWRHAPAFRVTELFYKFRP